MKAKQIQPQLPEIGYVLAVFPVSRSTWWSGVKEGRFPMPIKLGPRMTAWRVEDIRALIERLGRRDESEPKAAQHQQDGRDATR